MRIDRRKKLYMVVTEDCLELPVFIGESPEEVAEFAGVKPTTVKACAWRHEKGQIKRSRFVIVRLDEET